MYNSSEIIKIPRENDNKNTFCIAENFQIDDRDARLSCSFFSFFQGFSSTFLRTFTPDRFSEWLKTFDWLYLGWVLQSNVHCSHFIVPRCVFISLPYRSVNKFRRRYTRSAVVKRNNVTNTTVRRNVVISVIYHMCARHTGVYIIESFLIPYRFNCDCELIMSTVRPNPSSILWRLWFTFG